jgi:hypothetical protein
MNKICYLPATHTGRSLTDVKRLIFAVCLLIFGFFGATASQAQFADPALSTAAFFPIRTPITTTSELRFTFSNSGSTAIPANSIEIAVCPAFNTTHRQVRPSGHLPRRLHGPLLVLVMMIAGGV